MISIRIAHCATVISLWLVLNPFVVSAQTPFDPDSAASYLETLASTIGPRPMGSPAERKAMEFALQKFREFGLQEAYILPMNVATGDRVASISNTSSGTAVGVLRGTSTRVIVLGGHIDSASPEIPGANDDGSGSAAVIELARVLSRQPHQSTIVFALFGGEEQGLRGSRHFVENFPEIDRVVLMIQLDMANGSDWLAPLLDADQHSAPVWLVKAAYDEMRSLGHSGLSYPTHFLTLTNLLPGGIGSDHQPFLERSIPAIDFTSDINDPIHTSQDNFENFKQPGLRRSGDLVYRLVERFDAGVPGEQTGRYFLWQIGSMPVFFPLWLLYAFSALSLALAAFALFVLRKRRLPEVPHRTIPGLKLFALMLLVQACVWFAQTIVGLVKGSTHPWFNDYDGYIIFAAVSGIGGLWLALRLAPKLALPRDPYRYFLRLVVFLVIYLLLFTLGSPQAGLYPAVSLALLALAVLARPAWLGVVLWFLSPYMMIRLFLSEGFGLLMRSFAGAPSGGLAAALVTDAIMTLLFSLWLFPYALGLAAIQFSTGQDPLRLQSFRRSWGGYAAGASFLVALVYLLLQPTYSSLWQQVIRVEESFDLGEGNGTAEVHSSDYLTHLRVRAPDVDTILTGRPLTFVAKGDLNPPDDWIRVDRVMNTGNDSGATFNALVTLRLKYRPYTLRVSYSSSSEITQVNSAFAASQDRKRISFRWYSFPDTLILLPVSFRLEKADTVRERIEADFSQLAYPVEVSKDLSSVVSRTRIRLNTAFAVEQEKR